MIVSTVLAWLLVAVAFVVAIPALWMLARGLWPRFAEKSRRAADRGLLLCSLAGIVPAVLVIVGTSVLAKIPQGGLFAVIFTGLGLTWGFIGSTGFAMRIGEALWPDLGAAAPWRQTRNGGLVLICCALLPIIGWFVLLPLIAIAGLGAQVLSWFSRSPAAAPEAAIAA